MKRKAILLETAILSTAAGMVLSLVAVVAAF
jgi:hypothetical protein